MLGDERALVTIHPSAILRAPDEDARRAEYQRFVTDLSVARESEAG